MLSLHKTIQSYIVCTLSAMQVKIEPDETLCVRMALDVKWTQRLQLKNRVSGFGYLSELDKSTDKQLLRDKANVMLKHYPKAGLRWIKPRH